jgi:hypothetical protein
MTDRATPFAIRAKGPLLACASATAKCRKVEWMRQPRTLGDGGANAGYKTRRYQDERSFRYQRCGGV